MHEEPDQDFFSEMENIYSLIDQIFFFHLFFFPPPRGGEKEKKKKKKSN
jgi:hypothetical protein